MSSRKRVNINDARDSHIAVEEGTLNGDAVDDDSDLEEATDGKFRLPSSNETPDSANFFYMVTHADTGGVRRFMNQPSFAHFDINCKDICGDTALHVAVRRQDEEMIKVLLNCPINTVNGKVNPIDPKDTLLHAIKLKNLPIFKRILKYTDDVFWPTVGVVDDGVGEDDLKSEKSPKKRRRLKLRLKRSNIKKKEFQTDRDSEFNEDVTPVLLAAQMGAIEFVHILEGRGEKIDFPCPKEGDSPCYCRRCKLSVSMTESYSKLNYWHAETNPNYILYKTQKSLNKSVSRRRKEISDPLKICFRLIKKMEYMYFIMNGILQFSLQEDSFSAEYLGMRDNLKTFSVKLLTLCKTSSEVKTFLRAPEGFSDLGEDLDYPRLWWALDLSHKDFVVHPLVQMVLSSYWQEDWPQRKSLWDRLIKAWHWIPGSFILNSIILFIYYIFGLTQNTLLRVPLSRFINNVNSYGVFLGILCFQVLYPYQQCVDKEPYHCYKKGPPRVGTEWVLVCYVIGFFMSSFMFLFSPVRKLRRAKLFSMVQELCFIITFITWGLAFYFNTKHGHGTNFAKKHHLKKLNRTIWTTLTRDEDYVVRYNWQWWEPVLLSDAFLCVATILSILKLFQFVQLLGYVGPLSIALLRMIGDAMYTMAFYVCILCGFGAGFLTIYKPYFNLTTTLQDSQTVIIQDITFSESFVESIANLYWGLFGSIDMGAVEIVTSYDERHRHVYGETLGKFLLALFHVCGTVMVVNLLIGFFGKRFERVAADMDREWKFGRTVICLQQLADSWVPSPFSIFTIIFKLIMKCFFCCRKSETERLNTAVLKEDYHQLLKTLLLRYRDMTHDEEQDAELMVNEVHEVHEGLEELLTEVNIVAKYVEDPTGSKTGYSKPARSEGFKTSRPTMPMTRGQVVKQQSGVSAIPTPPPLPPAPPTANVVVIPKAPQSILKKTAAIVHQAPPAASQKPRPPIPTAPVPPSTLLKPLKAKVPSASGANVPAPPPPPMPSVSKPTPSAIKFAGHSKAVEAAQLRPVQNKPWSSFRLGEIPQRSPTGFRMPQRPPSAPPLPGANPVSSAQSYPALNYKTSIKRISKPPNRIL